MINRVCRDFEELFTGDGIPLSIGLVGLSGHELAASQLIPVKECSLVMWGAVGLPSMGRSTSVHLLLFTHARGARITAHENTVHGGIARASTAL